MKERHKAVPASYLILIKGDQILLGRRINTGYYDGWYTIPSGHVESGEMPLDALVRESKEEMGITFDKNDAHLVHTMYRAKMDETGDRADYFFTVDKWEGKIENKESDKCDDLRWFPINDLPNNLMHCVALGLDCFATGTNYSEMPFDEKYINPNTR